MRELVKLFKVLADETRLRILFLLFERECCVCEVMQALAISQSKASRGLTALHDVGLLKLRKEGLWSLYSVDREGILKYQGTILNAIETALANNKITLIDRERLKKAERRLPGRASGPVGDLPIKPVLS